MENLFLRGIFMFIPFQIAAVHVITHDLLRVMIFEFNAEQLYFLQGYDLDFRVTEIQ
jgi:hypothetical protein